MSNSNFIKLPIMLKYAVLTAVIAGGIPVSFAQTPDIYTQNSTLPNKHETKADRGIIGLAIMSGTQNIGGNNRPQMLPIIEYHWSNGWFAGTRQGIGYSFSQNPDLQYGVFLNADLGRPATGPSNGIAAIGAKPVLGAFANYSLSREWMMTSSLRYGAGSSSKGAVIDLGANYNFELSPQLHMMAGVAASLANSDYMQSYYGVTANQSITTGYATYSPSAGLKDVRTNLMLRFDMSRELAITAGLTATQLSNAAKSSPIISKPNSISGLLTVSYAF